MISQTVTQLITSPNFDFSQPITEGLETKKNRKAIEKYDYKLLPEKQRDIKLLSEIQSFSIQSCLVKVLIIDFVVHC